MTKNTFTLLHSRTISNMVMEGNAIYVNKSLAFELLDTRQVFFSSLKTILGEEVETYAVKNTGISDIIQQVNIIKKCNLVDLSDEINLELNKLFDMIDIEVKITNNNK